MTHAQVRDPGLLRALADLAEGRPVILSGDAFRGGDIDVMIPAAFADAAMVNLMATHARGLICVGIMPERAGALSIGLVNPGPERQSGRPQGVSVDAAHGISTGISAPDRALTIALMADPATRPDDLVKPGHVFPLISRAGGVRERMGAVEAALDLCRLAGLAEIAVLCAVMREDGSMARVGDLADIPALAGFSVVDLQTLRAALG
jgi:3,4-dihydroxy 2-butanone 4-phosphate synthase/GTP cyclohydrolase II